MRPLLAACGIFLVWVVGAAALPVVTDEAYYFAWAKHLDLGYFDHPPLVALMSLTAQGATSPLAARAGTLVVAALTLAATVHFFRAVGLRTRTAVATGLMLAFGSFMGLVYGFIATPDTGLMLAWILALAEAAYALRGNRWRWLTAGAATGLGLWAKYTMLLIGLVFLWALVVEWRFIRGQHTDSFRTKRTDDSRGAKPKRIGMLSPDKMRPALATPWPYLGGLVCLLVLSPHLLWNAQHDWITFRFQLRHGLATEHMDSGLAGTLPRAEEPEAGGPEHRLAEAFAGMAEAEGKEERAPRPYDQALKALNRYFGYYGSQIGLWGATAVVIGMTWYRRRRRARAGDYAPPTPGLRLDDDARPLVVAATAVPLLVFGFVSLFAKVEANWSAMYVIGAAALLTPWLAGETRLLKRACLINSGLVVLGLIHANTGLFAARPHRDRLMVETHGYPELARVLATLDGPVFADSYQLTAMMAFHAPAVNVRQWPGITRDSEFVRRAEFSDVSASQLGAHGVFWLVSTELLPPYLPGFSPVEMAQLRDCKDEGLQVITSHSARDVTRRCKKPIHEWYLVRYVSHDVSDQGVNQ